MNAVAPVLLRLEIYRVWADACRSTAKLGTPSLESVQGLLAGTQKSMADAGLSVIERSNTLVWLRHQLADMPAYPARDPMLRLLEIEVEL